MTLASWHSVCQTIVQSLCSTIISRRIVSTSKSYAFWHRNLIFLWSSTPVIFHVANAMLLEEFFFLSFTQHSYTTGECVVSSFLYVSALVFFVFRIFSTFCSFATKL